MVIYRCHCCGEPAEIDIDSMIGLTKGWRELDEEIAFDLDMDLDEMLDTGVNEIKQKPPREIRRHWAGM